ncbi:selenium cofactor biosynthesis protein YqeC [Chloroflexota bacterium]
MTTSLEEAFEIQTTEVISLVGSGGKTTLMFALARELAATGRLVITTTTTKILEPSPFQTPLLIVEPNEEKLIRAYLNNTNKYNHITLAREKLASGKLGGINPELVIRLAELKTVPYIIVESDGAAHKSLKAPNATEPVIPYNTSIVIPVVGIDAIDCRLTSENVFRPTIVSKLLGLPLGEVVSAKAIAFLITHPQGIAKGSPPQAKIIPFLNKTDSVDGLSKGRDLANEILIIRHPRIGRVILGQAQLTQPVVEVT